MFTKDRYTTLNSYGYSPHPLSSYLEWIHTLLTSTRKAKPIILSITSSSPTELASMLASIQALRNRLRTAPTADAYPATRLAVELIDARRINQHQRPEFAVVRGRAVPGVPMLAGGGAVQHPGVEHRLARQRVERDRATWAPARRRDTVATPQQLPREFQADATVGTGDQDIAGRGRLHAPESAGANVHVPSWQGRLVA